MLIKPGLQGFAPPEASSHFDCDIKSGPLDPTSAITGPKSAVTK